jgi:hypothetical protein
MQALSVDFSDKAQGEMFQRDIHQQSKSYAMLSHSSGGELCKDFGLEIAIPEMQKAQPWRLG